MVPAILKPLIGKIMPKLPNLTIDIDVDAVLRGQGADPAAIRSRRPALVKMAEQAIAEAMPLLEPSVVYKEFAVEGVRHERLLLSGGAELGGKLIVQHLAQAEKLYALVCTIGASVEQFGAEMWSESPVYSLAIDGVGSAAVEALANAACANLEQQVAEKRWNSSVPLSPGMIDWSVDEGQPQIFKLLAGEPLEVELTPSYILSPRKSLTMVVGVGPHLEVAGRTCDFCSLRDVCRYQDHYAHSTG
jgi:hypothetical protein